MANDQAYAGTAQLPATASDYGSLDFMMRMVMGENATAKLVRVVKCTNDGGVSPVGQVDVQPLVGMLTGDGKIIPHTTVFGLPYHRVQGGGNAVIIDPEIGDLGVAVFCDRDISAVKETKAPGPPGSYRQFSISDGLYIGGFLNAVPTQYVRFKTDDDGIEINSPNKVEVVVGPATRLVVENVGITVAGVLVNIVGILNINGQPYYAHQHDGVTTGGGVSGGVIP